MSADPSYLAVAVGLYGKESVAEMLSVDVATVQIWTETEPPAWVYFRLSQVEDAIEGLQRQA